MRIGLFIATVSTLLAAGVAVGQESGLRRLLSGADSRGWEAVGRLEFDRRAFCTGAMVAPDLVLTAAHCLFERASGTRFAPEEIVFRAGWRNRRATAVARVVQVVVHPEFVPGQGGEVSRVGVDLALLRLQSPVRKTSIRPFATAPRPARGDEVAVVSYARERADSPSLQESCRVLARRSGVLVMDCAVDFGASGAPVFVRDETGGARIVSVISARARSGAREVALGAILDRPLEVLMTLLANTEPAPPEPGDAVRVFTLGGGSEPPDAPPGARFLRP